MSKSLITIPLGIAMVVLTLFGLALLATADRYTGMGMIAIAAIVTFWNTFYTVDQRHAAILTFFGRFVGAGRQGPNFKVPFLVNVYERDFSLQVRPLNLPNVTDIFSKDNVRLTVAVAVQIYVEDKWTSIEAARFRLTDPSSQITSFVEAALRARVGLYTFDELRAKQAELSAEIETEIGEKIAGFGYKIDTTVIKSFTPPEAVQTAMSTIAEADYQKRAAEAQGEAVRIKMAKDGEGAGDYRARFLEKFHDGLAKFELEKLDPEERNRMYDLLALSMSLEAWKEIGNNPGTHTLFLQAPQSGAVGMTMQEMIAALQAAGKTPAHA